MIKLLVYSMEKGSSGNDLLYVAGTAMLFYLVYHYLLVVMSAIFGGGAVYFGADILYPFVDHGIEKTLSITSVFLSLVMLATGFVLYHRHTSKKSSGDTFGSAKIAKRDSFGDLAGTDGIVISTNMRLNRQASFEHAVCAGPTGCGKTSSLFIPNLLTLPSDCSIVVSDPKGELYEKTRAQQERIGRRCMIYAPDRPNISIGYNPLTECITSLDVRELATTLITNGNAAVEAMSGGKSSNAEFATMAIPLLTASLLFAKELEPPYNNIAVAASLCNDFSVEQLQKFIQSADNKDIQREFNVFKQSIPSEKTAASIKTVLSSAIQMFVNRDIIATTSTSELHPSDLRREPVAVFVSVPERRSNFFSPLIAPVYHQMINNILETEGLPVFFFLDEFANIGVIPQFPQLCSTARSRKISITIGIQGVEQLTQYYGQGNGEAILNNMKTKIFYPGLANTSSEYASKLCGYSTVSSRSWSTQNPNSNFSESKRETLTPDEVRRLSDDNILVIAHNKNPIITKQNRYFSNPSLVKLSNPTKKAEPREVPLAVFDLDELREYLDAKVAAKRAERMGDEEEEEEENDLPVRGRPSREMLKQMLEEEARIRQIKRAREEGR